ncbi:hypothetical protein B0H11DRAFT_1731128 [Mycena galericulata]|nr:hypothetical protein B0H11DRAFT_1731128 [Mycena galericulata]
MLASSGSQPTIQFFLKVHWLRNPLTIPRHIISDFCWPQINACSAVYCAFILLCWWHVLHAWQQHFHISTHPELWELLKRWIRMTTQSEFDAAWTKIQDIAPAGFIEYLNSYWMTERVVRMWSAVYRTSRNIFEACNTNMLIEAWHHVLKGKFLHGKRNRRLDHLLSTLLDEVLPYYALKQRRQQLGFEGPDIEVKKRQDIIKRSKVYVKEDIVQVTDEKYLVPSKSDPAKYYEVDVEAYTCTCLDYPLISYCKHLCAVQELFDEPGGPNDGVRSSPHIPSLSTSQDSTPAIDLAPTPCVKPRPLTQIAEKLERLAGRLRRHHKKDTDLRTLPALEAALDAMLLDTDDSSVLPPAQYLPPNKTSAWAQTKEAMMPGVKTRKKATGDPSYGGGSASGSKAKRAKTAKYLSLSSSCLAELIQLFLGQKLPPQERVIFESLRQRTTRRRQVLSLFRVL